MNSETSNSFECRTNSLSSCASEDLFSNDSGPDKSHSTLKMVCIESDEEKRNEITDSFAEINMTKGETGDLNINLNPILKNIDLQRETFKPTPSVIVDSFYREGIESESVFSEDERLDYKLDASVIVYDINNKITFVEESDKSSCSVIDSSGDDNVDTYTTHSFQKSVHTNVFNSTKKQVVQKWLRNFSLNSTPKLKTEYNPVISENPNVLTTQLKHISNLNLESTNEGNIDIDLNLDTECKSKSSNSFCTNASTTSNKSSKQKSKELSVNKNLSNIQNDECRISPKVERRYNLRRNRREGKENKVCEANESDDDEDPILRKNSGNCKAKDSSFSHKANSKISFRQKKNPLKKVGKFADEDDFMSSIIDSVMGTKLSSDEESIIPHRISDVKALPDVYEESTRDSINFFTPRRKLFFRRAFDNSLDDEVGSEVPTDIQPLYNNAVTSTPLVKPNRLKGLSAFLNQTLSTPLQNPNLKQKNPHNKINANHNKLQHNSSKENQKPGTLKENIGVHDNVNLSNKLDNSGTSSSMSKEVTDSKAVSNKSESLNSPLKSDKSISRISSGSSLSKINGSGNIDSLVSERTSAVTKLNENPIVEDLKIQEPTQNNTGHSYCNNSLCESGSYIQNKKSSSVGQASSNNIKYALLNEFSTVNDNATTQTDSHDKLKEGIYDQDYLDNGSKGTSLACSAPCPQNTSSDEVSTDNGAGENDSFTMRRRSGKRRRRVNLSESEEAATSGRSLANSLHDNSSNETPFRRNSMFNGCETKADNINGTEVEIQSRNSSCVVQQEHSSENEFSSRCDVNKEKSLITDLLHQSIECKNEINNKSNCPNDNDHSFAGIDTILNSSNFEPIKEIHENVVMPTRKSNICLNFENDIRFLQNSPMRSFRSSMIRNSIVETLSAGLDLNVSSGSLAGVEKKCMNNSHYMTSPKSSVTKQESDASSSFVPRNTENSDSHGVNDTTFEQNDVEMVEIENPIDEIKTQFPSGSVFLNDKIVQAFNKETDSSIGHNSEKHCTPDKSVVVLSDSEDSFTPICRSKTPLKKNILNDSVKDDFVIDLTDWADDKGKEIPKRTKDDFVIDLTDWADDKGKEIPKRTSKKNSEEKYDPDLLIVKSIDTSWSDSSVSECINDGSVGECSSNDGNDDSEPWIDLATYLKKNVPAMSIPLDKSTAQKKQKTISEIVLPGHSPCPEHTSFLLSLTEAVPDEMCHPEAVKYRDSFETHKNVLIDILFKLYNQEIFYNKLPLIEIKWSGHLTTTSGITKSSSRITKTGKVRTSTISLSKTVVNCASILRDVLIHELCHAANWLIDEKAGGHGPLFRKWADRVWAVFPEIPKVNVCHKYELNWKYIYRCTYCGYEVGKMKLSLKEDICRLCGGRVTVNN